MPGHRAVIELGTRVAGVRSIMWRAIGQSAGFVSPDAGPLPTLWAIAMAMAWAAGHDVDAAAAARRREDRPGQSR